MDRVMILSPHLDDEVLSASSFLYGGRKDEIKVVYFTSYHPVWPAGENAKENEQLVEMLATQRRYLHLKTNELQAHGQAQLITRIESEVNDFLPDIVVVPFPSYNQDHREVYEAALTAMRRHDANHWVKRILLGEQPETFDTLRKVHPFKPTYYRPLDWEFKAKLFDIYRSQQRGHRSMENLRTIAQLRGMQANCEYAEAFEVVRWID